MDKNWIQKNWFKLSIPASILLGFIIFGAFFYIMQVQKQQSIERQQTQKFEEERKIAEIESELEKEINATKNEQNEKEYIADRKDDCLTVYKTEDGKWNNVSGWRYDENSDECMIRYKESPPKSEDECDRIFPISNALTSIFARQNSLCKNGEFENPF
ncbi:MAG: hypothetical protein R3B41_01205 [Candidatus Doudnabacteria bacterium]